MQDELQGQAMHPKRDGLTIAFELVFTPALCALGGHALDRWLGTSPLFLVAFAVVSFVTVVCLTIWRYNLEMDEHDAERRAAGAARPPAPARWERRVEASSFEVSP